MVKLKRFLRSNKLLFTFVCFLFRIFNKKRFFLEVDKRKRYSIFNYKEIAKPLPYYPYNTIVDNNIYGLSFVLNKYIGVNAFKSINYFFEHGYFFGNYVSRNSNIYNNKGVITFGNRRKLTIQSSNISVKNIYPIGPFIHYAYPILDETSIEKIKNKLKKTLLVFPSHSIPGIEIENSLDAFISTIEELKEKLNIDNVLISLYWLDALNEEVTSKYESQGYFIVCSGHKYDPHFMERQKVIIGLCDYSISNEVGTHVAYCTHMGKPHKVVDVTAKIKGGEEKLIANENIEIETYNEFLREKSEIAKIYSDFYNDKENPVLEDFFGFSLVMNKEELINKLKMQ